MQQVTGRRLSVSQVRGFGPLALRSRAIGSPRLGTDATGYGPAALRFPGSRQARMKLVLGSRRFNSVTAYGVQDEEVNSL